MLFKRIQTIESYQENGRVVMIYGPRRVGKTTLVKNYLNNLSKEVRVVYETGDDLTMKTFFEKQDRKSILDYAKQYEVIAIDEAQLINNIGVVAKIIIDEFPEKKIILTGSSSFELSQQTGEPLVGRQYTMNLLPISVKEFGLGKFELNRNLESFLIYGFYPEILIQTDNQLREEKLKELISSYLFKDILALDKIKYPELLLKIVTALAYQIGSEVSTTKLAKDVGESDHKIIGRYLDILQKTFVIKKVGAYSNNLRNEIRKNNKYYFYDLGLRNAIINNYKRLEQRDPKDLGALWENFIFMELFKKSNIERKVYDNFYFWRNLGKNEIDIVMSGLNNELKAYECKWGGEVPSFKQFVENYPSSKTFLVNRENYGDILL